ncbi:M20 metallopeptidase family protein [Halalkalibacter krulwichiae]|uniref:Putative hydrolase YxeP n=1 Tax=Halalkalibacter krulwichiae TaxID=199441 RepID=A0A1X9MAA3_9BACI|nr:M20 family metallopeptidase [Halalkalibacter krulwichiae]ARK30389.1 putative hydrolase YxeP [Halalkalibacter krulwichiae]
MVTIEHLIKWRRDLHQHPELSFEEFKTTKYIINQLKELPGVRLQQGKELLGIETGVLAVVGDGSTPIVGLRADIDALPVKEQTGEPFQSCHEGIMHACGHDGHTAMLLGAVHYLSHLYQRGKLKGTVKCLFQPAEEAEDINGKTGAQYVLDSGALSDVESIIALHLDPELSLGNAKLKPGIVMANVDTFTLNIFGSGGHGAYPEQTIDPIWLTSMILPYFYSVTSRKVAADEPAVLSICQIIGGASTNVIPEKVTIKGTIRSYSDTAREKLVAECKRGLKLIKELGGTFTFHLHQGEPALVNNQEITKLLENILYQKGVSIHQQTFGMGGEDFSHITRIIPGAMIFLGAKDELRHTSLHQPTFSFNESVLEHGMEILVEGALAMIKRRRDHNGS